MRNHRNKEEWMKEQNNDEHAIVYSFIWKGTKEGRTFWQEVEDDWKDSFE